MKEDSKSVEKAGIMTDEQITKKVRDSAKLVLFTFTQPKASLPVISAKPIQINNKYMQVLLWYLLKSFYYLAISIFNIKQDTSLFFMILYRSKTLFFNMILFQFFIKMGFWGFGVLGFWGDYLTIFEFV